MSHDIELVFDSSVSQEAQKCLKGFLENVCNSAVAALQQQFQDYELDATHDIHGHHSSAYLIQANYSVTHFRVQGLRIPRSKLMISCGPELNAQLVSEGSLKLAAHWQYQITWGPQDKGEAEADVNDLAFNLVASLQTKPPSLHVKEIQCSVGSIEFKFRAGVLSAIYGLFSHILSTQIKDKLNSKLQEEAKLLIQRFGLGHNT